MKSIVVAGLIFQSASAPIVYKGISIVSTPRYDRLGNYDGYCGKGCNGKKYELTEKQILDGCKKFIDRNKFIKTGVCHQMTGGPFVIDSTTTQQ